IMVSPPSPDPPGTGFFRDRHMTQRVLYQLWLSPFCRKVRLSLAEKKLDFELKVEKVWERRRDFLKMNPSGEVPVLVDEDGSVICDSQTIVQYLDDKYPEKKL